MSGPARWVRLQELHPGSCSSVESTQGQASSLSLALHIHVCVVLFSQQLSKEKIAVCFSRIYFPILRLLRATRAARDTRNFTMSVCLSWSCSTLPVKVCLKAEAQPLPDCDFSPHVSTHITESSVLSFHARISHARIQPSPRRLSSSASWP